MYQVGLNRDKTGFFKKDNIYPIIRITGSQNNILGVIFDYKNNSDSNIEVIEWDFPNIDKSRTESELQKKKFWNKFFPDLSRSINLLEQLINYLKFIFHLLIAEQIQFRVY